MSLEGKVAVVTRGSRGIGRAIVRRFLADGACVVSGSRTRPPDEDGEQLAWIPTDVSVPEQARRLVDAAVERHGRLDVLVNNAALEHEATVEETEPEDWDRVMAVNLRGPYLCARAAIPHLRRAGGGTIVNVGSVDGLRAEPGLAAYCTSKGGLLALTRSIAVDYGADGIRCTCVCPSYVATEMLEQFYDAQPDPVAARAQGASMHPLGRISTPEEVAALAAWLASDEASFANGQAFVLDGGLLAGRRPFA